MKKTINIAIVDDNHFLIKAVEEKLSFFEDVLIKLNAYHGKELLDKLETNKTIDVILMDIEMPEMDGIQATEIVKQKYPHIKIIMLTVFDNDENIFKAIKAGADGYLLKEVHAKELYAGLQDTLNGGAAMNPSIAVKTLQLLRNPITLNDEDEKEEVQLSERETQVLEQLSTGLSYTQIADNLFLSPSTVRKHLENIYKKLQVHNKLEAVQKARKNRLIN